MEFVQEMVERTINEERNGKGGKARGKKEGKGRKEGVVACVVKVCPTHHSRSGVVKINRTHTGRYVTARLSLEGP